ATTTSRPRWVVSNGGGRWSRIAAAQAAGEVMGRTAAAAPAEGSGCAAGPPVPAVGGRDPPVALPVAVTGAPAAPAAGRRGRRGRVRRGAGGRRGRGRRAGGPARRRDSARPGPPSADPGRAPRGQPVRR